MNFIKTQLNVLEKFLERRMMVEERETRRQEPRTLLTWLETKH